MPVELQVKVIGETPAEARAQLMDLFATPVTLGGASAEPSEGRSTQDESVAQKKIDMVFARVGSNIRKLITMAASFENGYQTDDLAKKMQVTPVTLRSYAANLGRTMKRVNQTLGDDTPIYVWDDQHGKWVMPEAIRKAVLAKTK